MMTAVLLLSLAVVVVFSDRFLRETGNSLVADQDRVAKEILEQSVAALKRQAEDNLAQMIKDKARQLDDSLAAVERIVNLESAAIERQLAHPEEATDVFPLESRVFNDPATRPRDFGPEPGKNRKVSLSTVLWHRAPSADAAAAEEKVRRLRGVGYTMRALYREHPLSAWVYLGTVDGVFLGYPADDAMEKSYDHRTRDWYRDAKKSRKITWSTPYVDPSGALTITCSRPFHDPTTKELAGVAAVDVTLDQLNALISELETGRHGWAFLLDGAGRRITSPDTQAGAIRWNEVFPAANLLDEADPELASIARRMVADENGVTELRRADGRKYLAFAHVPTTDWSIGVLLPESEIVGPTLAHEASLQETFRRGSAQVGVRVDEARNRFLRWGIVGVAVLLMWTTGFVYLRLTHPVKGFIRDIGVISRGNLDHRVISPVDNELGDLAKAFNEMTEDLKVSHEQLEDYSRTLERKVEERTAELAASNAELAEAIRRLQDAQSRLVHSEKMASLGQLVAGIAHEINNPVNFIANAVQPLQSALEDLERVAKARESGAPDEEVRRLKEEIGFDEAFDQMRRALELIKTGASRTKAIVLQLRNFSRLDEAEMKEADIHEGLDGSLALLNYKLKDKVEVVRDYGAVGKIHCYPGQLNQVFMNILANGVQAIADKGTITITTRREGDQVRVSIKDSGAGIPPHVLPKIFDPFFTTKDRERGTGLGLSISHGIVEKHGGRIDVTSEVGKGSEFVITLPATVPQKAAKPASAAAR